MRRLLQLLGAALLATVGGVVAVASPAAAALPDAHGFVLYNGVATVPSGTWPAATTVAGGPAGVYTIRFPGQAAKGGVVHVTAVNAGPRYCQAVKWGPSGLDEIVVVLCAVPGGALSATAFSAFFESSSGPAGPINGEFGYVHYNEPTGTLTDQYNSVGAPNSVTPTASPGVYEVKLPGLSTPASIAGGLQVTAVNSTPGRCKVRDWTSGPSGQLAYVACFTSTGLPFKTSFVLTYQYNQSLWGAGWPPRYFGYLWFRPPVGPPQTNFNSQLGYNINTLTGAGLGLSLVQFPSIGVLPDNVQVSSYGPGPEFCNILYPWTHTGTTLVVRDVACYNAVGSRVNAGFLISANSNV